MTRHRAAGVAILIAVAAGCGGDSRTQEEKDLDATLAEKAAEINASVPDVGLGEAGYAPAEEWKTDFDKRSVELSEIEPGGPPKDGIPPIDTPRFETALNVDWLRDREPVIVVTHEGVTRGYPLQILVWHEIVNDTLAGRPIAVTFCPLCNTAIVFDRRVDGRILDFGTTGKLRESDLVMYDRQTESWWQQFSGEAIVGEYTGTELEQIAARIVAWREFRETHPESEVLSRDTGVARDYGSNPYTGYDDVDSPPIFDAANAGDDRLPPKERVVFVAVGSEALAVPFTVLRQRKKVTAGVEGKEVVVTWRPGVASALDTAAIAKGRDVGAAEVTVNGVRHPFSEPFWFAVAAFREDVALAR
jgi:hypothetical protein